MPRSHPKRFPLLVAALSLSAGLVTALLAAPAAASDHGAPRAGPGPDEVMAELRAGNARFVAGTPSHPRAGPDRVRELVAGQTPLAVVLGCSDSRVPPEILFDQGIGDLFVVRVAGNVSEPATTGSIEYAAEHLGTPLVVVLGHRGCGAVAATAAGAPATGNLGAIVREIQPAVKAARKAPSGAGLVPDAVLLNARAAAGQLVSESPVLRRLVAAGKVRIAVAIYDLESGAVEWP